MFFRYAQNRRVTKLISVALSVFLYVVMLPVVSSAPLRSRTAARPAQQAQQPLLPNVPPITPGSAYRQTNFVSDIAGLAFIQEPTLINPWGIAFRGTTPFWVSNNGTFSSSLYRGDVAGSPLVKNPNLSIVTVPGGLPTGIVGNSTTDFAVTPCSMASCPATFIWATITGNIVGWNPNAGPNGTTGVIVASHAGRVYTGLANGAIGPNNRLYAADFANGNIDVYDANYALTTTTGAFADPTIPTAAGNTYHPFNIQNIGGSLYVMYAKVGTDGKDEAGVGNGFVRRFNTDGVRDLTFGINNGPLNSPWGIAIAPASFGIFSSALLIGNFGEGNPSLHAFNSTTGAFLGTLQNENGDGIEIDELWGLQFGNGVNGGDPGTLYFTAGIGEEEHGLFGSLKPTTATATSLIQFATEEFVIGEGVGHIDISVTRAGDASAPATVNFNTFDESPAGHASQKSDYQIALGKVSFAAGETAKTLRILIVNDAFVEGDETINLALSNPTGAGVGLGSPNQAELKIVDNDAVAPTTNPIDDSIIFVRQHYLDFLNREPDSAGLNFWVNQIESCGTDAACREIRRINVSAAFFLSIEFQKTGLQAYLTHRAAFGNLPPTLGAAVPVFYGTFERDTQALQKDFVVGAPGADAQLEANTLAFFNDFITRPEFVSKYPNTLTNAQFVDNLLASAGLSPTNFVVNLTNSQENPSTFPTTSGGVRRPASFGTATFNMNPALTQMTFTATINNIDLTGSQSADTNDDLTAAHIHASPSVTPSSNGPVVWGFFGAPQNDNNPNDVVTTPSGVGGTISGKWDAPEGNSTTFANQLANLKGGHAYINFHTTQFGGGEIRGNFPELDAFRNLLVAGLDDGPETRATVLRKVAEFAFLKDREFNSAFVFMEYAGYLRRDPDASGFNFWLKKLREFNGNFVNAEMVKAFINSGEYRQRFGS
ncbi:MAG TPA: TIGR03118 family protein [Pyrinomonadaceae bacterium]|nr:TIGR03118 family protein [Pyrinomonadaceae bacterium]